MQEMTFEELCQVLRADIEKLKQDACPLLDHDVCGGDGALHHNMSANLMLVLCHFEDARMRVDKVLQAKQSGIPILDK